MARKPLTFDDVRALALVLPEVEVGTSYGATSVKVRGKMMACPALHKSAEPNSMVVRIGFKERDKLLADDPEVYYLKDHYVKYPALLVRLARIKRNDLQNLLYLVWEFVRDTTRPKRQQAKK